jgi:serine/threonine-protein kinase
MTPEADWNRVEALFDAALDRPRPERDTWVRQASAGDAGLADEVLAMLAAHDQAEGMLDRPLPVAFAAAGTDGEIARALAGRYALAERLGEGGMATVHLARRQDTGESVVIKVLKPAAALWFGAERFRNEVALAARLSHPNILGLVDSGESAGFLWYVMPWIEGETLRTRLTRGPLAPAEAVPLLRGLADALAYAHADGVVHRDLKPENVLTRGSHAWLMDFGIARLASAFGVLTQAGAVLGTPGYMAPEQELGRPVDHRADLWSFGVVARECLTGHRGQAAMYRPETPPGLLKLIARCLMPDPMQRPAEARELVEGLERLNDD